MKDTHRILLLYLAWILVGGTVRAATGSSEATLISLLIVPLVYVWLRRRPLNYYGITLDNLACNFAIGMIVGLLSSTSTWVVAYVSRSIKVLQFSEMDMYGVGRLTVWFLGIAFVEELVFRGIIFYEVLRSSDLKRALICSSLLFSIGHIFNPSMGLLALANLFLGGLLLALLTYTTNSIVAPIAFHTFWNLTLALLGSPISGIEYELHLVEYEVLEELVSGGAFGLEGGVASTMVLSIIVAFLTFKTSLKRVG